jgi:hypothetical protein
MSRSYRLSRYNAQVDRSREELANLQGMIDTDTLLHRNDEGISEHPGLFRRLLRGLGRTPKGAAAGDVPPGDPWERELEKRRRDGRS